MSVTLPARMAGMRGPRMKTLAYLAVLDILHPAANHPADAISDAETFARLVSDGSLTCGRVVLLAAAGVTPDDVASWADTSDTELRTLAALRGVTPPGWVRDSL